MPTRSRAATYARRRKRRLAKVEHDLTDAQWQALQAAWGGCAYCGSEDPHLQKDCVIPILRGGRYTVANVVPACRSCNASKCAAEVTSWMRRKRLDEPVFLVRQALITRELTAREPQAASPSDVEAELHHVAVAHDVVLALHADPASGACLEH